MLHRSGLSLKFHCSLVRFFVSAMISSFERIRLSNRYFLSASVHTGTFEGSSVFVCPWLKLRRPKTRVSVTRVIFIVINFKSTVIFVFLFLSTEILSAWSSLSTSQTQLGTTFMYETWLSFRSDVLSHVTKRNLKTKLKIYTVPSHGLYTLVCVHFLSVCKDERIVYLLFRFRSNLPGNTNLSMQIP